MKKHWKPLLSLLVLSPVLTELLTTSAPASSFFQPGLFLLFITVGYGFPVLVIREISVRENLGLPGLFFLGVMYGLYNEALVARTIFNPFHSPVDTFATYGLVENIRIPWALVISFWHALHAVIYPIAFVCYLFPSHTHESWIGRKTAWSLGIISLVFGVLIFFSGPPQNPRGEFGHFIFIISCWILLGWLSMKLARVPKLSREIKIAFSWKWPGLGLALYLALFFLPLIFSKLMLEPVLFVAYFMVMAIWGIRRLSQIREVSLDQMVLIALGAEIPTAFFTILITLPVGKLEQAASSFIFIIIFVVAIAKVKKRMDWVNACLLSGT